MEKPPGQRRLGSEDPSGRGEGDCYTAGEGEGVGTWHAQAGQGISGLESEEGKGEGKELPDRQEPSQLAPHKGERPTAPTPWEAGVRSCRPAPPTGTAWGRGREGVWPRRPAAVGWASKGRRERASVIPPRGN